MIPENGHGQYQEAERTVDRGLLRGEIVESISEEAFKRFAASIRRCVHSAFLMIIGGSISAAALSDNERTRTMIVPAAGMGLTVAAFWGAQEWELNIRKRRNRQYLTDDPELFKEAFDAARHEYNEFPAKSGPLKGASLDSIYTKMEQKLFDTSGDK